MDTFDWIIRNRLSSGSEYLLIVTFVFWVTFTLFQSVHGLRMLTGDCRVGAETRRVRGGARM